MPKNRYFASMSIGLNYLQNKSFKTFLLLLLLSNKVSSQAAGCTDALANNFNAAATLNDGSCTYNATSYTPPVKVDRLNDSIRETSGLQFANNGLWTFNDSGGDAVIYKIDTLSNTILQRVYLTGAVNKDWEDIAFDGTYFYIGDFGNNNNGARTDLKIYKFPIGNIPPHAGNPVVNIAANEIEVIGFSYADQPQPPVATSTNNTKFDCEAMLIDNGQIHLFTKDWINSTTTHYIINSTNAGNYILTPKETLATNYLVTAADKPMGQDLISLLGYQKSGLANHFIYLLSNYSNGLYFNGNKRKINLPDVTVMGQAEGISFRDDSTGYISNEKFIMPGFNITINPMLKAFNIGAYVSTFTNNFIFTGNGNWSDAGNWQNNQPPPAILPSNAAIIIDPLPGGECILDIAYSITNGKKITVLAGKKFLVQGNLIITQ